MMLGQLVLLILVSMGLLMEEDLLVLLLTRMCMR